MSHAQICGTCEHFTFAGSNEAEGIGSCTAYNDTSHEPLVRWDHAPTILYGKAPDMAKRVQWIEMRKREEGGNAAAA